jgi:hypothetical protein
VLTLRIPVAEKAKPRRIPISVSGGSHTAIEAHSEEGADDDANEPVGRSA